MCRIFPGLFVVAGGAQVGGETGEDAPGVCRGVGGVLDRFVLWDGVLGPVGLILVGVGRFLSEEIVNGISV